MAENNKVEVKIFGQQYTIAGGSSREDVERVAEYVDSIMNRLSKNLPSLSTRSLAVLAAVNITSEYFETDQLNQSQAAEIEKMKADAERYAQLWEDAKNSLLKYREETKDGVEKMQDLQRIFNMKNVELNSAKEALEEVNEKYEEVQAELREAEKKIAEMEEQAADEKTAASLKKVQKEKNALQKKVAQLEEQLGKSRDSEKNESQSLADFREKYKELANSFFDIQMENITLKNELDEYRKQQQGQETSI